MHYKTIYGCRMAARLQWRFAYRLRYVASLVKTLREEMTDLVGFLCIEGSGIF